MKKMFGLLGMTVGGWLGWVIGAPISIFTAFIVSIVGTGVGLYIAHKVARQFMA
jgi:uncharacterized membrane protein YeaQ/YmgE (transglycosylase-associated protein family)